MSAVEKFRAMAEICSHENTDQLAEAGLFYIGTYLCMMFPTLRLINFVFFSNFSLLKYSKAKKNVCVYGPPPTLIYGPIPKLFMAVLVENFCLSNVDLDV